jgi:hypothetical protein
MGCAISCHVDRRTPRFLVAIALFAASCLSPTLPLPPPEQPETIRQPQGAQGVYQVAGTCTPGARVVVLNESTGRGAVYEDRDASGAYSVVIEAEHCAVGSVSQEIPEDGESASAATRFVFQETSQGIVTDVTPCPESP